MVRRFGWVLFSVAIIGIGVATLICAYLAGHAIGPHRHVLAVIPWPPAIPSLGYLLGLIFLVFGVGLFVQRTRLVSSITIGVVMLLCALGFDVPRHPNLMSAEWRTNVLEPIVIGCMACLALAPGETPEWVKSVCRYLLAFALIVFGIAHFQVLTFIATMVPGWIPWHSFWTVFFGVAFIAAGVSFAGGFLERWAALGLGLMFALWLLTIHLPPLINGGMHDPDKWSDVLIVAALWGGSWSLMRDRNNTGSEPVAHA